MDFRSLYRLNLLFINAGGNRAGKTKCDCLIVDRADF